MIMSEPTDTISIRVPKSLKESLEKYGKKNQITLNLLINQILVKNVQWDEHITKMGWLQFTPTVIREIFNHLDDEEIKEISKSTKTDICNGIKFIYGDTSLEHVAEFLDSWLNAANASFRHTEDVGSHRFMIKHSIGKNWSVFAITIIEEFVAELGYTVKNCCSDTDSYSFTLSK